MSETAGQLGPAGEVNWRKNRRLVRDGWSDLAYLPRDRCGWNHTLAALAYSARRQVSGGVDLNLWAVMHGCAAAQRYAELGEDALVLWHGTSALRAERIRQYGLFHKRGVWATTEPRIAHGYTRGRSSRYSAGSAMVVLLFDRENMTEAFEVERSRRIIRFHESLPPERVEYILWDDRIEFVGERKAPAPKRWGVGRFKRARGKWIPRSRPPVRFDAGRSYRTLDEWLELSVRRILETLGRASAIEIFSSLYAAIEPTDALPHEAIFAALDRLCVDRGHSQKSFRLLALADENTGM